MSNSYFKFRYFTVHQDRCGMKVGTDGTLLGAWAKGGRRILDIGTGTGLIAMMLAQRFPDAVVDAIDIDADACSQAADNVAASPFGSRIRVSNIPLQEFNSGVYDAVVCNPPFFTDSLKNPDKKRSIARHASTLTYRDLFCGVSRVLSDAGEFSAIIPFDCRSDFEMEAVLAGFFVRRVCAVKTTPYKQPRRYMISFGKHPVCVENTELIIGSSAYEQLVGEFYL